MIPEMNHLSSSDEVIKTHFNTPRRYFTVSGTLPQKTRFSAGHHDGLDISQRSRNLSDNIFLEAHVCAPPFGSFGSSDEPRKGGTLSSSELRKRVFNPVSDWSPIVNICVALS